MTEPVALTEVPGAKLYCGDALDVLRSLPSNSIDLIATDPPYYRVKGLAWDRAWNTADGFLAWIGQLTDEWCRVLKPNGSLYCFASPKMAARVEVEIGNRMEVLNRIRWVKEAGWHNKTEKEALRSFLSPWEEVIFAERLDAKRTAPIGDAIAQARRMAGLRNVDIDVALGYVRKKDPNKGTELCRRWEEGSSVPSATDFINAMMTCGDIRPAHAIHSEYDFLVAQHEYLRRPFAVTADVPYTDVWDFKTVPHRPGKHVCEKPLDLCEHIILASSRPGAVVLDSFCGSGAFGHAAVKHGRTFIGSDNDPHWIAKSAARIASVTTEQPTQPSLFPQEPRRKTMPVQGSLLPESAASCP